MSILLWGMGQSPNPSGAIATKTKAIAFRFESIDALTSYRFSQKIRLIRLNMFEANSTLFLNIAAGVVGLLVVVGVLIAYMGKGSATHSDEFSGVSDALKNPDLRLDLVPVMNRAEQNTLAELHLVIDQKLGREDLEIYPQVSLGGLFKIKGVERGKSTSVFNTFKAKRFDYLIADPDGLPVLAVEYNGAGHARSNHLKRDDTKRFVTKLAGLPLVFIEHPKTPLDYVDEIGSALSQD